MDFGSKWYFSPHSFSTNLTFFLLCLKNLFLQCFLSENTKKTTPHRHSIITYSNKSRSTYLQASVLLLTKIPYSGQYVKCEVFIRSYFPFWGSNSHMRFIDSQAFRFLGRTMLTLQRKIKTNCQQYTTWNAGSLHLIGILFFKNKNLTWRNR